MELVSNKIVVTCPYCRSLYKVDSSLSGKQVTCNKCKRAFAASAAQIKSPKKEDEDVFLCKIALNYGLITEKNLEVVFTEYARMTRHGQKPIIDQLLMAHGHLSKDKIDLITAIRENWDLRLAEKRFAEEAVRKGFVTSEQARSALVHQAQFFSQTRKILLVSDILIEKHILKPEQCQIILQGGMTPEPGTKIPHDVQPQDKVKRPAPGLEAIRKAIEASKEKTRRQPEPESPGPVKKQPEIIQHRSLSLFGKGSRPASSVNDEKPGIEPPKRPSFQATRNVFVPPQDVEQNKEVIPTVPVPKIPDVKPRTEPVSKPSPPSVVKPALPAEDNTKAPTPKIVDDNIESILFSDSQPEPDVRIKGIESAAEAILTTPENHGPSTNDLPVRPVSSFKKNKDSLGDNPTYLSIEHDEPINETEHDGDGENSRTKGPRTITINGLELIIAPDGLVAHLKVPEGVDPAFATVENIKNVLKEEFIIFGIVEDALIRGFLNSKIFREKPFKIAEGTSPVNGRNGSVKYHFDTDYLKVGQVTESGGIDYRNRGEIPFVKEGDLLAEITPAVIGKSGMDIFGNDLLVPQVKETILKCEAGTRLSDDKRKVFAAVSGQPKLSFGDRLFVLSELVIPGDVSFKTGHIDFAGNVIINGTIQSDFTVKGANVTANDALSARIIATGDVDIKNGISSSFIQAQGNVKAKFINKSTIKAYGNVIVEKEIIDCEIVSSGACLIEKGTIVTSEITSKQGIQANAIGTEMSRPCHLKIGVDDHINNEVAVIDSEIEGVKVKIREIKSYMKDLDKKQKEIQMDIAKLAHIQDRSQLEQKKYRDALKELGEGNPEKSKNLQEKIEAIDNTVRMADSSINENFDEQDALISEIDDIKTQISDLNEKIDDLTRQKKDMIAWVQQISTSPFIKTKGPIYNGTIIVGANCSRVLKETMRAAHIHEARSPDAPEGWEIKIG